MIIKQAQKKCGTLTIENYLHHSDFLHTAHKIKKYHINVFAKKFLFEPLDYITGYSNLERKDYIQLLINNTDINFTIQEAKQLLVYLQNAINSLERKK